MLAMNKWHHRFLRLALEVASWSKDPNTKVGAVLVQGRRVIATGYNGFPPTVPDDSALLSNRTLKNALTVHAEVNAILNAARHGQSTEGTTIYTTFFPCPNCMLLLMAAGVKKVVALNAEPSTNPYWQQARETTQFLLNSANARLLPPSDGYWEIDIGV